MNKLTKEMNHNVLNPECPQNNGSTSVCLCQMFIQKLTNITRHQDPAPKESSQEWENQLENGLAKIMNMRKYDWKNNAVDKFLKSFIRKLLTEKDTEWHNKWDKHNTERLEAWEKKVKESYEEGYVARGAVESAQKQRMFEAGKILGRKEEEERLFKKR